MSYKITSNCNNCGACEPECPNMAIAMGSDIFEINSEACTECVGFFGKPQCVAVCPVDACVTDPANVETEADLLKKARELHPDKTIADDAPSHFRK